MYGEVELNMNGRLTLGEADPVRFGSDRFLLVVAEVYMGGDAARATSRVSVVYAEKKG